MVKHKYIDLICIGAILLAVLITLLFMNGSALGIKAAHTLPGYQSRLFDKSKMHFIDIVMDDWDAFLDTAPQEVYHSATLVIDGETFHNVGLRAKGNNSLRLTNQYGLSRYSLKVEFDHYLYNSYYGLDKFSLDSSFQDNSYMKTFLTYDMMEKMGVAAPLCSYVFVRVNGKDWGLFVAVEEPEEAFARRNFGREFGQLYKPDYKSLNDENADVALRYIDDNPDSYDNIFRNAKFDITLQDKQRVIEALRILSTGENLEQAVNIPQTLRFFVVQSFVVNLDSYLGKNGHNYFLHEKNGVLTMLPWDYNLAFATYSLGMPNPINDANLYVNFPINTPAAGDIMRNRPLYHNLMKNNLIFAQYHALYREFLDSYFFSGYFEQLVSDTFDLIAPYVEKDPTAFCSYEDFCVGSQTLTSFCWLRALSCDGQLKGTIPATIRGQQENPAAIIDASEHVWLPDLGEISDLENPPRKNTP